MTFQGRTLTDDIIDVLEAADLTVGDNETPAGAGWQGSPGASAFLPYVVVYPTTGGYFDGSIAEPFGDARPDYVVSAFGATRAQAQHTNDRAHAALIAATVDDVQLISPDVEGGVVRDDDVTPPVYYSPTRWRVFATSA